MDLERHRGPTPRAYGMILDRRTTRRWIAGFLVCGLATLAFAQPSPTPPMPIDRVFQTLPEDDATQALLLASEQIGGWSIELAGVTIQRAVLADLAHPPEGEPLLRHVRETLGRPVDLDDLLYWLDDVVVAGGQGRSGEAWFVPSGRARAAGILIHPDDVFNDRPRKYAQGKSTLAVDEPSQPAQHSPAADHEQLGPRWTARYPNPETVEEQLLALHEARPTATFPSRIGALFMQLDQQGAEVWLTSTVRRRERGYLMWGALLLARATSNDIPKTVARLEEANEKWGLNLPIQWSHPQGITATQEAARQMAEAYDVVHATENGARYSHHYTGLAVDLVAVALPRSLTLMAPDGARQHFDLSDEKHTRDLSLEPELIEWIEAHFGLRKLRTDYPHWTDTHDP